MKRDELEQIVKEAISAEFENVGRKFIENGDMTANPAIIFVAAVECSSHITAAILQKSGLLQVED